MDQQNRGLVTWLFENAGPIIRWRLIGDFLSVSHAEREEAKLALLESSEVKRWLDNLGDVAVHGAKDTHAENAMAKLVEYGLRAGMPAFDAKMLPYAERMPPQRQGIDEESFAAMMTAPFLIAAGYAQHPAVRSYFLQRLDTLYDTAIQRSYDLYLPQSDESIPSRWRDKLIYKPAFYRDRVTRLPTCYDLYALAHWPDPTPGERRRIEVVVDYLAYPDFQSTPGGYLWDPKKRRCYSAGRVYLACLNEDRKVLFVELMARFSACRRQPWFQKALADLESYRTERGSYRFPADYLHERRDSYYIYSGAHMGLGENRRRRDWREIESTFRMLSVRRLMSP